MQHRKTEEKTALTDQITAKLIAYIRENELKSGDALPNEKQLTELLHVSRSTLREAVRVLASRRIFVWYHINSASGGIAPERSWHPSFFQLFTLLFMPSISSTP